MTSTEQLAEFGERWKAAWRQTQGFERSAEWTEQEMAQEFSQKLDPNRYAEWMAAKENDNTYPESIVEAIREAGRYRVAIRGHYAEPGKVFIASASDRRLAPSYQKQSAKQPTESSSTSSQPSTASGSSHSSGSVSGSGSGSGKPYQRVDTDPRTRAKKPPKPCQCGEWHWKDQCPRRKDGPQSAAPKATAKFAPPPHSKSLQGMLAEDILGDGEYGFSCHAFDLDEDSDDEYRPPEGFFF
jgi:hypothetical protein